MRRRSRVASCFLLVGAAAGAQQTGVPKWPRVRVNVSVTDLKDVPATGVKADALEITDGKAVVPDALLQPVENAPESVCLLVDTSGSSYSARDVIHAELQELIQKLPAQDEICLIDFSGSVYVDAPFTSDRAQIMDALKYLKSSGGSALLDAAEASARYMRDHAHNPQRVLILITDGGENASLLRADAVWRTLHQPEAPVIYTLMNSGDTNPQVGGDRKRLLKLTEGTGGLEFPVRAEKDGVQAADGLVQAMRGRYQLEFTASDPVANGSERKLRVAMEKNVRKQNMKVVGPDGYVAAQQ